MYVCMKERETEMNTRYYINMTTSATACIYLPAMLTKKP